MTSDRWQWFFAQARHGARLVVLTGLLPGRLLATELQLTPDTCVRHAQQQQCELAVRVRFSEPQLRAFCLYLQHRHSALHCSSGLGEEEVMLQISLVAPRLLELRDNSQQLIATAPLKVAIYQPAQTRRRRGLGWNLL